MRLRKLDRAVSYKEKVYEEIKSAIIAERLKPGQQLNERKLAEELGISRTPVREAIQMLESEGWVKTEPWKGTYVLDITEQDIEEVFQLRMSLETLVIELIIQKIDQKEINRLDEFVKQQVDYCKEYRADEFIRTDRDFHMYLADLTGNRRLIQILNNLSDMMRRLGIKAIKTQERYKETIEEHKNIVKGLKEKNLLKAKEAMMHHVLKTKENVYKHWKDAKNNVEKEEGA